MRIGVIGGAEMLFDSAVLLESQGFEMECVVTARPEKDYKRAESDFERLSAVREIPQLYGSRHETLLLRQGK